jgi:hypothetical protein
MSLRVTLLNLAHQLHVLPSGVLHFFLSDRCSEVSLPPPPSPTHHSPFTLASISAVCVVSLLGIRCDTSWSDQEQQCASTHAVPDSQFTGNSSINSWKTQVNHEIDIEIPANCMGTSCPVRAACYGDHPFMCRVHNQCPRTHVYLLSVLRLRERRRAVDVITLVMVAVDAAYCLVHPSLCLRPSSCAHALCVFATLGFDLALPVHPSFSPPSPPPHPHPCVVQTPLFVPKPPSTLRTSPSAWGQGASPGTTPPTSTTTCLPPTGARGLPTPTCVWACLRRTPRAQARTTKVCDVCAPIMQALYAGCGRGGKGQCGA